MKTKNSLSNSFIFSSLLVLFTIIIVTFIPNVPIKLLKFFIVLVSASVVYLLFRFYSKNTSATLNVDIEQFSIVSRTGIPQEFFLDIASGLSLEERIKAGNYKLIDDFCTTKLHTVYKGSFVINIESDYRIKCSLLKKNKLLPWDQIEYGIEQLGFRPATFGELLAFGEKYPNIQREISVLAAGTVCLLEKMDYIDDCGTGEYTAFCPRLTNKSGVGRSLDLFYTGEEKDEHNKKRDIYFLVVSETNKENG